MSKGTTLKQELKFKQLAEGYSDFKLGPAFKGLSNRHKAFICEYIRTWNASEAARKVGYKNPNKRGMELVQGHISPSVSRAIQQIQEHFQQRALMDGETLQRKLEQLVELRLVRAYKKGWVVVEDPADLPEELQEWITAVRAKSSTVRDEFGDEITEYEVQLTIPDKLRAVDMINKMIGSYAPEKHQLDVGFNWDEFYSQPVPDDQEAIDAIMVEELGNEE